MSANAETWVLNSVATFRKLSFFGAFQHLSDVALANELRQREREKGFGDFIPRSPYADLSLLAYDEQRVWWQDLEADVCDENDVYVDTLQEWATISRGAFQPVNICEYWQTEQGPIHITFQYHGEQHTLTPEYQDDYIDVGILGTINRLIKPSGFQFAVYKPFDQTAFILVLTPDEQYMLQHERKWQFLSFTHP